ncbi:uncharacterized protein LOC122402059 [Colletes gigas]|uniref:uncharacterized protein LOC122402059 n=1 Tax=Colletes gigas TaxID=935657 RepID=UPI001C9AB1DD|nr:uncharacterized protein LOC122402059 [Colletes gigas]
MFHRPECRKYRQWKREQSKKSKQAVKKEKKIKRRDSIADCIEENEENNVPETKLKVTFRKCKKKFRIRKPRARATYVLKRISLAEILLKTIRPPIEVRERFLNPRHTACLEDSVSITDIALDPASTTRTPRRRAPRSRKRRKPVAKKPLKDDEKTKGDEETKEEKTEDQKIDEKATKGEVEDQKTDEEVTKGEAEDQSTEEKTTKSETKKSVNDKGTRKRLRRKKIRKKKIVKKDSEEDSVCESICSFDSHVCLAGLKLTSGDKKKIKDYQRQINNESTEENNYPDD